MNSWKIDESYKINDTGSEEKEFTLPWNVNAGTHEFKITETSKTNWYGYDKLTKHFNEVSEGKDGEGNPNGNIIVNAPARGTILVTFNIETKNITLESDILTEVKCYLMGNGDWENGVEMTINPQNSNEYMLLCQHITAPFKFKYGETWSSDVENYEFEGIDWVKDESDQYNITLPEGNYDFYFNTTSKKVYIATCTPTEIDVTLSGMVKTPVSRMGSYKFLSLDDEDGNQLSIMNGSEEAYGDFEVNGYLADYDVTVVGNGTWAVVDGVETLTATLQVEDDNTTIYNVTATVGVATTIKLECYDATYTITDPEFNEVTFTGVADGKEFTILVSYFGGEYYSEGEWGETLILGTEVEFDDTDAEAYYLGGTYIDDANNTYEVAIFGAPAVVAPETYTRDVTNKYGTICLPNAAASTTGAIFYRVAGKEEGKVYLESVGALEAGVPYIFEATAGTITVTYQGEAVAEAGTANGLVGTFTEITVPDGDYILYNNAFCTNESAGTLNKIKENRAYLDMDAVTGGAPQQLPGRRYISMDAKGENAATGLDNITNGENTTIKLIENGQLIIIRNGEKFNAQGVRF
jgi:hypothetical protein